MRKIPITNVLGLPDEAQRFGYSCFHPVDAGLLFAGCDHGQLHLFDLNASKGSFLNPEKPSISLDMGFSSQKNL
jgi:hypothetical protein